MSEQGTTAAPTSSGVADNSNVALIKRYYQAYGRGDLETVRSIFAPDIVWRIPGHHPLAGVKHGADEVFAFFQQLAKANFKAEVVLLCGEGEYVIDYHRGWGAVGEDKLDLLWCLVFRIKDNHIVEAINFSSDQHEADRFFWRVYQLKPIPERLRG